MKKEMLHISLIACTLIIAIACERDRDFDPAFPSREILGSGPYEGAYWPTDQWKSCKPEEVGMDSELLRKMNEDMVLQMKLHVDVHSVLVIRQGYVVAEQYYSDDYQDGSAKGYGGLELRPRDLAKFGLLYLKKGAWENGQLIPESWVTESTGKQILRGDIPGFYYGYQWWVHEEGLYAAVGYGGQILMIIPEFDLIVLFTNYYNTSDSFQNNTPWRLLDTYIIPAIKK